MLGWWQWLGLITFNWEGSDSEGTLPSFRCETLDSALRRSSRVEWNVSSDIVGRYELDDWAGL